jgi:hypothetical protein
MYFPLWFIGFIVKIEPDMIGTNCAITPKNRALESSFGYFVDASSEFESVFWDHKMKSQHVCPLLIKIRRYLLDLVSKNLTSFTSTIR